MSDKRSCYNMEPIELVERNLQLNEISESILFIGSVGFEDRSLAFLNEAKRSKKQLSTCIGVQYLPHNPKNRKDDFDKLAHEVFKHVDLITFNRKSPELFDKELLKIQEATNRCSHIIIDISAMSKMLIVVLLYGLRKISLPLSIIYSPAKIYHPTKEKFESIKNKTGLLEMPPYFLTTDVNSVVTTSELSSIAMQGEPVVLIAFPNFNHREISALLNETNAQEVFLIEGKHKTADALWRLDAIRWINGGFRSYSNVHFIEIYASDIKDNIKLLDQLYQTNYLSHKIALAPTGGKLQAVASFFLKVMHPDIQIIYPCCA